MLCGFKGISEAAGNRYARWSAWVSDQVICGMQFGNSLGEERSEKVLCKPSRGIHVSQVRGVFKRTAQNTKW